MSIQLNTKKYFLGYIKSWLGVAWQILKRSRHCDVPKVFFRYQTYLTHPGFASYYDDPPLQWSNWYDADLLHWINYPKFIDRRPFIVESNDHPLSAVSWKKKVFEPTEVLDLIDTAQKVYEHENCKTILIPCNGFRDLFKYYLPENICKKLVEVSSIVCNTREIHWDSRSKLPITFCCLASDYYLKGVDLVLKAWLSLDKRSQGKLILACPNIPLEMQSRIINDKSIVFIKKAPLTAVEKDIIFRGAHVSIAPTHVHGGANVAEGLEYGHFPIMFEYHAKSFQGIGSTIPVPYYFYMPEYYGKTWKTFDDFFVYLAADKKMGVFDPVVDTLATILSDMISNPEATLNSARECHDLLGVHFSSATRNEKLLNVYEKVLSFKDINN